MFKKIKGFFHQRNESGRSMVEMLGVLAVIGVLTVGGLAGYNYAMNKHRANTLLNEINLRFVVAQQQMAAGVPIDMSEFENTIFGSYKIDVYKSADRNGSAGVMFELSNIPYEVAKQFFSGSSSLWGMPLVEFDIKGQAGVIATNEIFNSLGVRQANASDVSWLARFFLLFMDTDRHCAKHLNNSYDTQRGNLNGSSEALKILECQRKKQMENRQ